METFNSLIIGKRIRELREDAELTQLDLAKALNVKRQTIAQWENGERDLKTGYIISLSKHFNVTSDYLLGISNNKMYENGEIGQVLGLSDFAIDNLKSVSEGGILSGKAIINSIAQTPDLKVLVHELSLMLIDYITNPNSDEWAVSEYRAVKTFSSIVDNLKKDYYEAIMKKLQSCKTEEEKNEFKNMLIEKADYKYIWDGFYFHFDHENHIFD